MGQLLLIPLFGAVIAVFFVILLVGGLLKRKTQQAQPIGAPLKTSKLRIVGRVIMIIIVLIVIVGFLNQKYAWF